jgi:hypothetical protein
LPAWGLWFALGVILTLHAVGETVTLSRIINAAPPLRWFDRLGTVGAQPTKPGVGSKSTASSTT